MIMQQITMTSLEVQRLKEALEKLPSHTSIVLSKEVTSEYGTSVILKYCEPTKWTSIDLTEMDNF